MGGILALIILILCLLHLQQPVALLVDLVLGALLIAGLVWNHDLAVIASLGMGLVSIYYGCDDQPALAVTYACLMIGGLVC